nr:DinB family protein [Nocardia bovistercoris]
MLRGWLDHHRATLLSKCAGLDADQLRSRPVPPSRLSLLGLVRHLAECERGWFRIAAAGVRLDYVYCSEADPDADFDNVDAAEPEADLTRYREEIAAADRAMEGLALDHIFVFADRSYTVRWVYLHMIEEYARHNGHADLLRERIDGVTGR